MKHFRNPIVSFILKGFYYKTENTLTRPAEFLQPFLPRASSNPLNDTGWSCFMTRRNRKPEQLGVIC